MITKTILKDREDWLRHRMLGIGGSEISSVVGENPYRSNVQLWEMKTGRVEPEDISEKPFVKYGTNAEEHIRELFRLDFPEYEVFYEENNSFFNEKYPWARASLDGWLRDEDGRLGILEIKTTTIQSAAQKDKWTGGIPQNYYCQVLFYMAVMEADFAVLKARIKSEHEGELFVRENHYFIDKVDVWEDMEYLMDAGAEFWEYVKNDICPALVLPNTI